MFFLRRSKLILEHGSMDTVQGDHTYSAQAQSTDFRFMHLKKNMCQRGAMQSIHINTLCRDCGIQWNIRISTTMEWITHIYSMWWYYPVQTVGTPIVQSTNPLPEFLRSEFGPWSERLLSSDKSELEHLSRKLRTKDWKGFCTHQRSRKLSRQDFTKQCDRQ